MTLRVVTNPVAAAIALERELIDAQVDLAKSIRQAHAMVAKLKAGEFTTSTDLSHVSYPLGGVEKRVEFARNRIANFEAHYYEASRDEESA